MNKLAAFTIFLGSFLSFAVQPLIGRSIIASFGGTASVWVVCLCAFQTLLLAGYFYADRMADRLTVKRQVTHLILLFLAAVWALSMSYFRVPIVRFFAGVSHPSIGVLLCVLSLISVPYVLLSSNSSFVQAFMRQKGSTVYKLYAISNIGSVCGLLAYPFLLEPYITVTNQWIGLSAGIAVYAMMLALLSFSMGSVGSSITEADCCQSGARPYFAAMCLWGALPAASCFLLNSLTTHITTDVMPMPLIWTMTLTVFLLSYAVGFSGMFGKTPLFCSFITIILGILLCGMNASIIWKRVPFPIVLGVSMAFLFFACTFLHSWLYVIRPHTSLLTKYYLFGSVGGAVGGMVSSLAFPCFANRIAEYPIALLVILSLIIVFVRKRRGFLLFSMLGLIMGVLLYTSNMRTQDRKTVYNGRGFFGTIQVQEAKARTAKATGFIREYVHGTTVHGIQALLPGKEDLPTTYYAPDGCGYAIVAHPKYREGKPMRVCLVGLGLGVLYSYGREGDYYRGYEISKESLEVATNTNLFTFISDCKAKHEEILEDARTGLEHELAAGDETYDVIIIDAFSGDSQPYHISTKEAFELYLKRLNPDGVLCVHITNWHLELEPFVKAIGDTFDLPLLAFSSAEDLSRLKFATKAAFFCREPSVLKMPPNGVDMIDFSRHKSMPNLPTDERGSFIHLIKW